MTEEENATTTSDVGIQNRNTERHRDERTEQPKTEKSEP